MRLSSSDPAFQSTPLREGRRRYSWAGGVQGCCFNPRPCARGDVDGISVRARQRVSIHAPARGATRVGHVPDSHVLFQSTPLREGRRLPACLPLPQPAVSIHAPARGATHPCQTLRGFFSVSIHAPARGATPHPDPGRALQARFNPRPCARGDSRPCPCKWA